MFPERANAKTYLDDRGVMRLHIGNSIDYPLLTHVQSFQIPSNVLHQPKTTTAYISTTSKFEEAMTQFGLKPTATLSVFNLQPGLSDKSPKLPEGFGNMTIDQALDVVAGIFKKIVVYSTCDTHYSVKVY